MSDQLSRQIWVRGTRAVRAFATSEVGRRALLLFGALVALLVVINGLNVVNSYVGRDFFTAIEHRLTDRFLQQAFLYIAVFGASTVAAVVYRFIEERLGLLWREWLTRRLVSAYLTHPIYYRLNDRLIANGEIANPDERIADDVRAFTVTTLSFVLLLLNGTFTAVAFSGVMWSISPSLFVVGVIYAAIGSLLTIVFGRSLVGLNYAQFDKEANFRADLVNLRENAESVALARQEEPLRGRLLRRLEDLTGNLRQIIAVNRNLGFFTTGYNYMIQIIPALVVAPLFIRGEVEFGVITQSAMAFSQLLGAFSLIVTQFQSISSFAAIIARLSAFNEAVEQAEAVAVSPAEVCEHDRRTPECPQCLPRLSAAPPILAIQVSETDERVAYEGLTLRSPLEGRTLLNALSVSILPGTRVLIAGPNDVAKVALFRATAGIWDIGEGCIARPGPNGIMFLPERPYLPPVSLRDLLVRPKQGNPCTDEQIVTALTMFHLEAILERMGGIDTEQNWGSILSLGEQQLIGFVRLVVAAPGFAFLDRLSTTLHPDQVDHALKILTEHSITYLIIGESSGSLDRYTAVLELAADGSWKWTSMSANRTSPTGATQ